MTQLGCICLCLGPETLDVALGVGEAGEVAHAVANLGLVTATTEKTPVSQVDSTHTYMYT
jgi:hypothetical protein